MNDRTDNLRGYAICSERRSGTHYFCELLTMTKRLGRPAEYFNADRMSAQLNGDYPRDPKSQVAQVVPRSSTPNSVYALKVFSTDFDRLSGIGWVQQLPNLRFIHFERLDYLGQAISGAKAFQTGRRRSTDGPMAKAPIYDAGLIRLEMESAARRHARWRMFFARNQIRALYLTYEALLADPAKTVQAVADFMGVDEPIEIDLSAVLLKVQRDAVSDEWRARFVAEEGGLQRLDVFERDTAWAFLRRKLRPRR